MFDQFDFVPQSDTMSLEAENMENKKIPSLSIYKVKRMSQCLCGAESQIFSNQRACFRYQDE